jgi:hypothetical protein
MAIEVSCQSHPHMWDAAERLKIGREEWEILEGLVGKGKTPQKWHFGCGSCCLRRKGKPQRSFDSLFFNPFPPSQHRRPRRSTAWAEETTEPA